MSEGGDGVQPDDRVQWGYMVQRDDSVQPLNPCGIVRQIECDREPEPPVTAVVASLVTVDNKIQLHK